MSTSRIPSLQTWLWAAVVAFASQTGAQELAPRTGLWNVAQLQQAPEAQWGEPGVQASGAVLQEVYYRGEPYQGRPTRVFAYFALPQHRKGAVPGVVLVHGGGGTAFREWALLWAERGYAALAMDLAGHGPERQRLEDGGPNQTDQEKFTAIARAPLTDMWTYHAVAAVLRGHSLLASRTEVDAQRIGVTGISWGGYLTCIVAGLDGRLQGAVPVYGCGFLHENSVWLDQLAALGPENRQKWIDHFDPSQYLSGVRCPMLFVNGTNDFAYPLDSYQKSYRLVTTPQTLSITVNMPHSHPAGWAPKEIGIFFDGLVKDGVPLPQLAPLQMEGAVARAAFTSKTAIVRAQLHYTTDAGPWKTRAWTTVAGRVEGGAALAELPPPRPLTCFLTITDERTATVSTPHVTLEKGTF